jgi:hypothetical protein
MVLMFPAPFGTVRRHGRLGPSSRLRTCGAVGHSESSAESLGEGGRPYVADKVSDYSELTGEGAP